MFKSNYITLDYFMEITYRSYISLLNVNNVRWLFCPKYSHLEFIVYISIYVTLLFQSFETGACDVTVPSLELTLWPRVVWNSLPSASISPEQILMICAIMHGQIAILIERTSSFSRELPTVILSIQRSIWSDFSLAQYFSLVGFSLKEALAPKVK